MTGGSEGLVVLQGFGGVSCCERVLEAAKTVLISAPNNSLDDKDDDGAIPNASKISDASASDSVTDLAQIV